MADITSEVVNDAGAWLLIEEGRDARLRALVHSAEAERRPEPGITVFWPALFAPRAFVSFFEGALPRVRDFPGGSSIDRWQAYVRETGDVTDLRQDESEFREVDFLRLECIRSGDGNVERPVLVAWANLDAGREKEVPEDAAGVLLQRHHLISLQQPLALLIAETSAERADVDRVTSMLNALGEYFRPSAPPLGRAG